MKVAPPSHNQVAPTRPTTTRSAASLILRVGLIAGTLDIGDNLIYNHFRAVTPAMVFRYIASGLVGPAAAAAGFAPILLGVSMHYGLALGWTALYYFLARRWPLLLRRPLLHGPLYGLGVYIIMNYIAVPLSRVPRLARHVSLAARLNSVLAVVLCVGLAVALLLSRAYFPDSRRRIR